MSLAAAIAVTAEVPDRYERRGILGVGGIGIVELAFDTHLGREIAIKRLKPALSGDSSFGRDATRRFLKEARIGAILEHPNIVPVYELGQRADGGLYYTMKRIRGRTLAEALRGADLEERLAFMPHVIAICNAMAYAHEHGVVHRDLKPDNVMVDAHGEALVVDWGLACERGADDVQSIALARELEALRKASGTQTVTGAPIGTPAYMPPEQARGELQAIDERSDVYTLGAILYELLTGSPPFTGPSALHILRRVLSPAPVDPPQELEPDAPPELAAVALRALAKDPADRYPDAAALAADLIAFRTGARVAAHAYGRGDLARRWLRTHRIAVGLCALTAIAATVTWWSRGLADARQQSADIEARAAERTAQADAILAEARAGVAGPALQDAWAFRLAALPTAAVTRRLIGALDDPSPQVRGVAARALGGRGGEVAVDALISRLEVEADEAVRVAVIQTLGVLGDGRAAVAVHAARDAAGTESRLWRRTAAAARLLTLPPPPADADAPTLVRQAQALAAAERFVEAHALFDRAARAQPSAIALAGRGQMAWRLRRPTDAVADLDAALDRAPTAHPLRLERAKLLHALEAYEAARADLDRLIAAGALVGPALRVRAQAYAAQGAQAPALADLERALRLEPDAPAAHLDHAELLLGTSRTEAALLAVSRALALAEDLDAAVRLRARIHWRRGARAAAIADAERLRARAPADAEAVGQLATWRRLQGDLATARALLDDGVARQPADPWRRVQRGTLLHAARGDFRAALADLDAARAMEAADGVIGLLALAVAIEVEAREVIAQRVAQLATPGAGPWIQDLVRVVRGEAPPQVLRGRLAHARPRACERALALAIRARLLDDRVTAVDRLAAAARLPDPDDPACALVRALSRR